ncbi:virulence factor family protein [Pseudomonas typographi]|uniref:virulence factor family protein n=1 Tax=Pseudomonas typographi TaxID=2715964 RepID=UPI0016883276|nr:virulence factor family protein [Pseudomonas typographi]MBD1552870.1 virulence factor family protein [Pseudomonas typographi]
MIRRYWRAVLITLVVLIAVAAAGYGWWNRPIPAPTLQQRTLSDGSAATEVVPGQSARNQVLLAVPAEEALSDKQLSDLSRQAAAKIVQVILPKTDCNLQQAAFQAGLQQLGTPPNVVGGIAIGGSEAWNWLAGQSNDKAKAVSVGFALEQTGCTLEWAKKAEHGHWYVAWNDWPDDTAAAFVRGQANAENSISDYDVKLPELLKAQLVQALLGEEAAALKMPVVEVPATNASGTVTLFLSGDGGWRDLDKDVAGDMAQLGYPVVGIDTLRYYWQHKAPEESAEDLAEVMEYYRHKWGAKHFILAGYSFGADVLPAIYNRLGEDDKKRVDGMILLAFARSGSFEIEVEGWLGQEGKEAPTGPEMAKLPAGKVLCVYGEEETGESGCTEATAVGQKLKLPGGHHFDENYPALAKKLIAVIDQWTSKATP